MNWIYLDNAATTKTDSDTAAVALDMMCGEYGNPSSPHKVGLSAQLRVDRARGQLASALGCTGDEVIFTSGATEANNIAILGGAQALYRRGDGIVAAEFEHASVLSPVKALGERGFRVSLLNPQHDGLMDMADIAEMVDDKTVLVSCMLVNSEIGAIYDIQRLVRLVRAKNKTCLIHCDAVQAFGKIAFSAKSLGVDLLSVSAHKLYAPKGCGALYIRKGARVLPLAHGGRQEKALRPGTESTALTAAFGHAAEKAARELKNNLAAVANLYEYFVNKAQNTDGVCINSPKEATPYIVNISVPGYASANLINFLSARGIFVSGGSACSGGEKSHVLLSMGLSHERLESAIRVSFSKESSISDIDSFFEALVLARRELVRAGG